MALYQDGKISSGELAQEIIEAIEALPVVRLSIQDCDDIFKMTTGSTPGTSSREYARLVIDAHIAAQDRPVTQKVTVRIYRDYSGGIYVTDNSIAKLSDWTLIDTIERDYPT